MTTDKGKLFILFVPLFTPDLLPPYSARLFAPCGFAFDYNSSYMQTQRFPLYWIRFALVNSAMMMFANCLFSNREGLGTSL